MVDELHKYFTGKNLHSETPQYHMLQLDIQITLSYSLFDFYFAHYTVQLELWNYFIKANANMSAPFNKK